MRHTRGATSHGLGRACLLSSLVAVLSGCSLYGLTVAVGATHLAASPSPTPSPISVTLTGTVVVPSSLTAAGALTTSPALSGTTPLSSLVPLTVTSPLAVSAYRVQADSPSWNTDGTVRGATVQILDLSTGQLLGTAQSDATGSFSIPVSFPGTRRSLMAQTLLQNAQGAAIGFLASPLAVDTTLAPRLSLELDSPSTLAAFVVTLMAGRQNDLDVRQGYHGLGSPRLSGLVGVLTPDRMAALELIAGEIAPLSRPTTPALMLSGAATLAGTLEQTITTTALASWALAAGPQPVDGKTLVGLQAAVLARVADQVESGSSNATSLADLVSTAVRRIDLSQLSQEGRAIASSLADTPIPALTPAPKGSH
jgi:hypothetical protein